MEIQDDMTPEEMDILWGKIYKSISKSIDKGESYSIIMAFNELLGSSSFKNPEDYSITIEKDQYLIFLKNYLMWSEKNERYETCIEIKNYIEILSGYNA